MTITYKLAMAAAEDAANKQMKAKGNTAWTEEEYALAVETLAKLLDARQS